MIMLLTLDYLRAHFGPRGAIQKNVSLLSYLFTMTCLATQDDCRVVEVSQLH